MAFWLLKTEPESFGIDHLAALPRRTAAWDGVRNYQARNFLRDDVRRGDAALLYHSSCAVPGVAGIARVVRASYPDPTALDRRDPHFDPSASVEEPRWFCVDLRLVRTCRRVIALSDLRAHAQRELRGFMLLQKGCRLSVMPIATHQFDFILTLE